MPDILNRRRKEGRKADTLTDNQLEGIERPRKKSPSFWLFTTHDPSFLWGRYVRPYQLTIIEKERDEEENELKYGLGKGAQPSVRPSFLPLISFPHPGLFYLRNPTLKDVFVPYLFSRTTSTQAHRP